MRVHLSYVSSISHAPVDFLNSARIAMPVYRMMHLLFFANPTRPSRITVASVAAR